MIRLVLVAALSACGGSAATTTSFESWTSTSQATMEELGRLTSDASNPAAAARVVEVIEEAQGNLDQVTPEPCYREAFDLYSDYLASVHTSMQSLAAGELEAAAEQVADSAAVNTRMLTALEETSC